MKPLAYAIILLLIIPVQASLLNPLSLGGIKPDVSLALIFIIGLLTGPIEAALMGIGIGLVLDIGSASLIGLSAMTRGMVGLTAGLLGTRVLNLTSPSNSIFLVGLSLIEGICIAIVLQVLYGAVPFMGLLAGRMLPQALYTGALGIVFLRLLSNRGFVMFLMRRSIQKEL